MLYNNWNGIFIVEDRGRKKRSNQMVLFFFAKNGSSAHVQWTKAKFFHFLLGEVFFEFLFQHTNINYKLLEAIPLEIILMI